MLRTLSRKQIKKEMKKNIVESIAVICACLCLLGCTNDESTPVGAQNLNLVFEDEFNGEAGATINTDNWNFEIGNGQNGWGNNELQYYTNRPENVALDGEGNMVITAIREQFQGFPFTSARITTKDKVEQQYGRFEARIKMPGGRGVWPAFWMLGSDIDEIPWPTVGEIDITELRGQEPNITIGSVHGPGYSGGNAISGSYVIENDRFDADFHEYAIEWTEDTIEYYLDGIRFNIITKDDVPQGAEWVFNERPFFMILNIAVGGNFVGFPVDSTPLPQTMVVDYVRIYSIED